MTWRVSDFQSDSDLESIRNSCDVLRYIYETTIFLARTDPTQWDPYPEVALDNFSFPVGGRLAARWAVSQL